MKTSKETSQRYLMAFMLFLVFTLLVSCLSGCGCGHKSSVDAAQIAKEGAEYQTEGIMSTSDLRELQSLDDKAVHDETLSQDEVKWLLSFSERQGNEQQKLERLKWVSSIFGTLKANGVPAAQKSDVFNFAVESINYPDPSFSVPVGGCYIFAVLRDKRAVPYLTALLKSNNSQVRRAARQSLHKITRSNQ